MLRELDGMREPDDCGLRHCLVGNEGTLDLGSPKPVSRHVEHIIDAAGNPVIEERLAADK